MRAYRASSGSPPRAGTTCFGRSCDSRFTPARGDYGAARVPLRSVCPHAGDCAPLIGFCVVSPPRAWGLRFLVSEEWFTPWSEDYSLRGVLFSSAVHPTCVGTTLRHVNAFCTSFSVEPAPGLSGMASGSPPRAWTRPSDGVLLFLGSPPRAWDCPSPVPCLLRLIHPTRGDYSQACAVEGGSPHVRGDCGGSETGTNCGHHVRGTIRVSSRQGDGSPHVRGDYSSTRRWRGNFCRFTPTCVGTA